MVLSVETRGACSIAGTRGSVYGVITGGPIVREQARSSGRWQNFAPYGCGFRLG